MAIIRFCFSFLILGIIGWLIYSFFTPRISYAIFFGIVIFWLLGQKNYTDSLFRDIKRQLQEIILRK